MAQESQKQGRNIINKAKPQTKFVTEEGIVYYSFDEGAGYTVYDKTINIEVNGKKEDGEMMFSRGVEEGIASYSFDEGTGGTIFDRAGNNKNGSISGATWVDGKAGKALSFDGTDDSVSIGAGFNQQTFSVSMWVSPGATQQTYADIIDNNHRYATNWVVQQDNTTTNRYQWGVNNTSVWFNLTPNQWTHVVLTRDANTRENKVYLNGVLSASTVGTGDIVYDGGQYLRLGSWGGGGRNWNGKMDELQILNRVLTPEEISYRYQNVMNGIVQKSNWVEGKAGTALNFNGIDDYVAINSANSFTSQFSVSGWFKFNALNRGEDNAILGHGTWSTNNGLHIGERGTKAYFGFYNNDLASNSSIPINTWTYLTYVYDGTYKKIYMNGNLDATQASAPYQSTIANAEIGRYPVGLGPNNNFYGQMDEFQILNRALTAEEIKDRYEGGFKTTPESKATDGLMDTSAVLNAKASEIIYNFDQTYPIGLVKINVATAINIPRITNKTSSLIKVEVTSDSKNWEELGQITTSDTKNWYTFDFEPKAIASLRLKVVSETAAPAYLYEVEAYVGTDTTIYKYDKLGKLAATTDPLGSTRYNYYSESEKVASDIDANGNFTFYDYNKDGELIAASDSLGNQSFREYDDFGNVIKTTDALGNNVQSFFDKNNRLTKTINAINHVTEFSYNANSKLTSSTSYRQNIDGTTTTITSTKNYDNLNRLVSQTDAMGYTSSADYDNLDRVVASWDKNANYYNPTHGQNSVYQATRKTYYLDGKLATEIDPLGVITKNLYDANGNLTAAIADFNGLNNKTTFYYDELDRLTAVIDPRGNTANEPWYNINWLKRLPLTIDNTANTQTLTDYQVKVVAPFAAGMQANFNDLRFTDSDKITELNYWIESTSVNSAVVWIKIPSIQASAIKTIYMYYASSVTTSASQVIAGNKNAPYQPTVTIGNYIEPWYSNTWLKRAPLSIDNTTNPSNLTDYQVKVAIPYDADMKADFSDLRFTDQDKITEFPYWIESYAASSSATAWLKVPYIAANSTKKIYMYYGNLSATSTSNGFNTFELFDVKDIKGYWKLDEGSGTTAVDQIGLSNGVLTSGTSWSTGKNGSGVTTSGSGYISVPAVDISTQWSIETWFLASSVPRPVGNWATLTRGTNDHQIIALEGRDLGTFDNAGGTGFHDSGFDLTSLSSGWHHMMAVGTAAGTTDYYIDGVLRGSSNFRSTTDIVAIGNFQGGGQPFGTIDEVKIYNKALSSAEVQAIYSNHTQKMGNIYNVRKYSATEPVASLTVTDWYNSSWQKRAPMLISNASNVSTLIDYQVKVVVPYNANMQANFNDLRFTDSDKTTELSYWLENITPSVSVTAWVKVPQIPANSAKTIYMYYGNANAASASNAAETFDFFDDFNILSAATWSSTGSYSVGDSKLTITTGSVYSNSPVTQSSQNYMYEGKIKWLAPTGTYSGISQSDASSIAGGNANGNAVILDMADGESSNILNIAADGTVPYYNTEWKQSWGYDTGTSYVVGQSIDSLNLKMYKDYIPVTNSVGTYNKPQYAILGYFSGSDSGSWADIKDIEVDWYRVRKYSVNEPVVAIKEEKSLINEIEKVNYVSWGNSATVAINNLANSSTLADYQVKITIPCDADMKADFSDLRFTDSDKITELSYWLENITPSVSVTAWVKVPQILANTTKTVYMYYGNANAASASNAAETFDFFDDFNVLNAATWSSTGAYSVANSKLTITTGSVYSNSPVTQSSQNYMYEGKVKWLTSGTYSGISQSNATSIAGGNGNGNAVIIDMADADSSTVLNIAADGTVPYYNTEWRQSWNYDIGTSYVVGQSIDNSNLRMYKDYIQVTNSAGTYNKAQYAILGYFSGSESGSWADIKDIEVDWYRVRKYSTVEPTATIGTNIETNSWLNNSWTKRQALTIDNSANASNLADYQVKITIPYDADMKADFSDLRFTDTDKTTQLNYWVESYASLSTATVWLRIPAIQASSTKIIYMYYGNQGAVSTGDGDKTFDLFDDFSKASINTSKWNTGFLGSSAGTDFYQSDGALVGGNTNRYIQSKNPFTGNYIAETKIQEITPAPNGFSSLGFYASLTNNFGILVHNGTTFIRNDADWPNIGSFNIGQSSKDKVVALGTSSTASRTSLSSTQVVSGTFNNSGINNEYLRFGSRYDDWASNQNYLAKWDWVFVRKYSAIEPTIVLDGVEETSFAGQEQNTYKTLYQYDERGNKTAMITPAGTTTYKYDDNNRVIETTDPKGVKTYFTYDKEGNLLSATGATNKTDYIYDANDKLIKETQTQSSLFEDKFDTFNGSFWNMPQPRLAYHDAKNGYMVLQGTGSNYDANFYGKQAFNRSDYPSFKVDFMSNSSDSALHVSTQATVNGIYKRFGLVFTGGNITFQSLDGPNGYSPPTYISSALLNTWYTAEFEFTPIDAKLYVYKKGEAKPTTPNYTFSIADWNPSLFFQAYRGKGYIDNIEVTIKKQKTTSYEYDNKNRLIKVTYPDGNLINYIYDNDDRLIEVKEPVVVYSNEIGNTNLLSTKSATANDFVATTSTSWVDMPGMIVSTTTANNPISVTFKAGGVQVYGVQNSRGSLRLLIDDQEQAFTLHEYNNNGWELRDVSLFYSGSLTAGAHTFKVQWKTESGTLGSGWFGNTRSLIVDEVIGGNWFSYQPSGWSIPPTRWSISNNQLMSTYNGTVGYNVIVDKNASLTSVPAMIDVDVYATDNSTGTATLGGIWYKGLQFDLITRWGPRDGSENYALNGPGISKNTWHKVRLVFEQNADGTVSYKSYLDGVFIQGRNLLSTFSFKDNYIGIVSTYDGGTTYWDNLKVSQQKPTRQYKYDTHDNLAQVTDINGVTSQYTYDANDRLTSVSSPLGGEGQGEGATIFTYDPNGNILTKTYPNGLTVTNIYDAANRLTHYVIKNAQGVILEEATYVYDNLDNIIQTSDARLQTSVNYVYDQAGELIEDNQYTYTYDVNGNMLSRTNKTTGEVIKYEYNAADQLVSAISSQTSDVRKYTYNSSGATTSDANYIYEYDAKDRLVRILNKADFSLVASYTYDYLGRRASKTTPAGTTNYYYNDVTAVLSSEQRNGSKLSFIGDNNRYGKLISLIKDGQTYYYVYNGNDEIIGLTDGSGAFAVRYSYDSWGNPTEYDANGNVVALGTFVNPYLYKTYYYDTETNLYYLNARYYNPEIGRFLSQDPDPGSDDDRLSKNNYVYGKNNPVNNEDPDGHWSIGRWFKRTYNKVKKKAKDVVDTGKRVIKSVKEKVRETIKTVKRTANKVVEKARRTYNNTKNYVTRSYNRNKNNSSSGNNGHSPRKTTSSKAHKTGAGNKTPKNKKVSTNKNCDQTTHGRYTKGRKPTAAEGVAMLGVGVLLTGSFGLAATEGTVGAGTIYGTMRLAPGVSSERVARAINDASKQKSLKPLNRIDPSKFKNETLSNPGKDSQFYDKMQSGNDMARKDKLLKDVADVLEKWWL